MPKCRKAIGALLALVAVFTAPMCLAGNDGKAEKDRAKAKTAAAKTADKPGEKSVSNVELLVTIEHLKSMVQQQSRELDAQRAALIEQQRKTEEMQRQMLGRSTAPSMAESPAGSAQEPQNGTAQAKQLEILEGQVEAMADNQKELGERVTKLTADTTAAARSADTRLRQLGNFRFSGDLRFRYEPFLQSQQTTRQRVRFRARLNLTGNITDELYGGVTFATGSLDDPISTNQTLTGFFNRKQVGFDRYFIQYTPKAFNNHAQFGLGKFAFPWIRTTLTFDTDMNPEGVYTRLNWDSKHPVFKGITVVSFWLPIFERGGSTSATTGVRADGLDAFAAGGQIQTHWKFGDRVTLGLHVAGINFVNADFIAQAQAGTPATAALANNVTGNQPTTNTLRTNVAGQVIGYASRFLYLDAITTLGVNTGNSRLPLNITFDFVNNLRAQNIIQNGTAAPTGTAHNNERSGYFFDVQLGRLSERKDFQFGYQLYRIERDAVITAFNESDLRAGSNLLQHRLNFNYQWWNNVSLNYALWVGRLANAPDNIALVPGGKRAIAGSACNVAPFSGCKDNFLKRMQFDLIYRF